MALILAYQALGAPVSPDSQSQVQSVIDALKAQMNSMNMAIPYTAVIDRVEASLRLNGVLDEDHLAALDQKIQTLTSGKGIDSDVLAAATVEYLTVNGAFDNPGKEEEVEAKMEYLTADMVNEVLARGSKVGTTRDRCHGKDSICYCW